MPAQKRSVSENLVSGGVDDDEEEERDEDSLHQHFHRKQPRHVEPDQVQPQDHHHQHPQLHQEEGYVSFLVFSLLFFFIWISLSLTIGSSDFYFPDSDENPSSSTEEKPEYFLSLSLSLSLSQSSSICLSICVAYVCELIDFGALGEFLGANVGRYCVDEYLCRLYFSVMDVGVVLKFRYCSWVGLREIVVGWKFYVFKDMQFSDILELCLGDAHFEHIDLAFILKIPSGDRAIAHAWLTYWKCFHAMNWPHRFVFVGLPDIRKDVQCPICLGTPLP
ncbi:hypothetical protein CK203_015335 [Vitis vinifera]|uniref:Uncharacterized protein n=1 Tax=Vitis vinifera TaxID=29760 RepID=A0A438JK18_VITVI|nr:hypothetical protein CK203_015335 [Vitis vinifera]